VFDDRRRFILLTGDRDMFVANGRWIASQASSTSTRTLLATAGDRLALEHFRFVGAPDAPEAEVEVLILREVDAEGRGVAVIVFDPAERRAASAELFERYLRSDSARWMPASMIEFARAMLDHDLDRMRAALPDDFFVHDHRRTGMGRIEGADDYVASVAAVYEQSPDAIPVTLYDVVVAKHGWLSVGGTVGTLTDGGEFESIFVRLMLFQGDRFVGAEMFELEDLDVARARFEELRPDPLRIPPNAASRARDRTREASRARDWPALRALVSDDFVFDDRTKRALITGGVELWIASMKQTSGPTTDYERELVATFGERIALDRLAWAGETDDGIRWEADKLRLTEVDADGRIRASITFDLDDRGAAFAEARARFAAGEAAPTGGQAPILAFHGAFARHDWEALRESLDTDAVIRDHRPLGLGVSTGDQWLESLRVLADLASDVDAQTFRILAWNRHGRVDVVRLGGTMPHGGGPFENIIVRTVMTAGDRLQRCELFAVGDADQALARFEELGSRLA